MKDDEQTAPEDPLVSSLTAYHESRAKGSTDIRPSDAPAEDEPEFAELLLRAQACVRLLDRRWSGPNRTGGTGEIASPLLSASSGILSPGDSAPARIGRFQIRRELGRGAFGIVFLALDPALGREVALKVARPETTVTPQFRRRFLTEAQAAAALNHANVVSVFESGEWGPIYYIAQEYCVGPTLAEWLKQRSEPVPEAAAATLVATLAAALDYAHEHGIIHRDLKPSNVLLVPKSGGDYVPSGGENDVLNLVPKIADFGLAKLLESSAAETRSGLVLGTPGYMAPEQVEGRLGAIGPQTDIHALGVILYEMLTGRPPFFGATDVEMLKRVVLDEPARPRGKRGSIPRDLEAICLKCLEKQPSRRYPTAAALADDLVRFLAARPTVARPLGSFGRAVNWARRRPAAATLLAISVLAGPAVFSGTWWHRASLRSALGA
ncbi:MAG TPA: serine/threonine-protein kinase, partial [Planctomycetaceae bacterium]|nr:serine/threonine-protein kinase [Planctomycetaceae bacterium]